VLFDGETLERFDYLPLLEKVVAKRGGWAGVDKSSDDDKKAVTLAFVSFSIDYLFFFENTTSVFFFFFFFFFFGSRKKTV
jgi:hypothetical protein